MLAALLLILMVGGINRLLVIYFLRTGKAKDRSSAWKKSLPHTIGLIGFASALIVVWSYERNDGPIAIYNWVLWPLLAYAIGWFNWRKGE